MANDTSLTPMMEQYFRVKGEVRDAFLFFRLGDFYEMFYEDAKIAAPLLGLALTSRQKVPMCGVPYHAVNSYLTKLLRLGHKVAICDQVEDPKTAKGVVKREVIKVLTPGTAVEIESDDAKETTFIASVDLEEDGWGLALADLVSGEMRTVEGEWPDLKTLADEMFRAAPKEILFPEGAEERLGRVLAANGLVSVPKSPAEPWLFDYPQASHVLLEHFGAKSLAGFGLADRNRAVSAAGALLYYMKKVRRDSLGLIDRISYLHTGDRLNLDATTIRNLELVRNLRDGRVKDSLLDVVDFTVTAPGGRLLRAWLLQPLFDAEAIRERLDAVEEALRLTIDRRELRDSSGASTTWSGSSGKISLAAAHPRDLVALKRSLAPLPGDPGRGPGALGEALPGYPRPMGQRGRRRRPHREGHPGRTGLSADRRRDHQGRISRRARRAAIRQPLGKDLHRPDREAGARADGHRLPQGPLQQGFRLLHRGDEAQPSPGPRRIICASRRSSAPSAS